MKVEKNNKVIIEYEGRFDSKDGEIFDTSKGKQPLTFIAGIGMVVPGFDNAVLGMDKDEEKEIILKPEQAYGEYRDELKQKVPRNVLPKDQEPKKDMMMMVGAPNGQQMPAKIVDVDDENITLDLNPPLAGKTLYFKIKMLNFEEFDISQLQKPEAYTCGCAENEPCKTGEEDCKCEDGCEDKESKSEADNKDDSNKEGKETSIEDLAEGK